MSSPRERRQQKRQAREVPNTAQPGLPLHIEAVPAPASVTVAPDRYVVRRTDLFVGDVPLRQYLLDADMEWVVVFTRLLSELDYRPFLVHTARVGRRPFHPSILLGLQLYGLLQGKKSLRELQQLASIDVAAWYVCGGHRPDHSTLGNFILDHKDVLTEEFFLSTTKHLLKRLQVRKGFCAIDGTVVESAASRFGIIRLDALREKAAEAEQAAQQEPQDAALQRESGRLVVAREAAEKRAQERKLQSKDPLATCIVPQDSDAVVQPRKDGPSRPAYKPSLNVHESGLIVGQSVDPQSELTVLDSLLEQHERLFGEGPEMLAMDGGYHAIEVLRKMCEREIDVLCPSSAAKLEDPDREDEEPQGKKLPLYGKERFEFDEATNTYVCPAGQRLHVKQRETDRQRMPLTRYQGGEVCGNCEQRSRCTTGKNGRSIRRYDGEELKAEMKEVMKHPVRRAQFALRKATVEPVFGEMKGKQGADRFNRKGIGKVRAEWSLHCTAYNLRKAARRFRVKRGSGSTGSHESLGGRWGRARVARRRDEQRVTAVAQGAGKIGPMSYPR